MSQLFTPGGQSIGASASASVQPKNIQDWFSLGLKDLSLGLETEDKGPWPGKPGPGQDNTEKSTHPSFTFLLWKRFMRDVTREKCAVKNAVTWGPTQNSIQVYLLPLLVLLLFFLKAVKTLNSICLSEGGGWQYRNHRAVVRSQWGNFQVTLSYETKERSKMNLMTAHGLGGSEEKWVGHLAHWQHFFLPENTLLHSWTFSFHTVHGVLKAGILKWFAVPFFAKSLQMVTVATK